ncbi:MAG: hypothetical protein AAGF99_14815 [Bacteroidota bacterium]
MASDLNAASRLSVFASAAALSATQDLVRLVMPRLTAAAQPDLVAEETLALVSTVTARAAETGLRDLPGVLAGIGPALAELPFLYHDYLLGVQLIASGEEGDVDVDQDVYDRLARKAEFYAMHLPPGRFPGPRALDDKLPLWMGRISPPRLPTTPQQRLADVDATGVLSTHARLVLAFAQKVTAR